MQWWGGGAPPTRDGTADRRHGQRHRCLGDHRQQLQRDLHTPGQRLRSPAGHDTRRVGHDGVRHHGQDHLHVDPTDRRIRRVERILADFTERGWVWFDGDRATLTDEGRAAHDAAFARVREVRAALAAGIPADDYATTLATLEAMARNLGWEPGEQPAEEQETGEDQPQAADQEQPATPGAGTDSSAES